MLLQRLREYADRHAGDLGPPMYIETPIRYEIPLDREGNLIGDRPLVLTGEEERRNDRGREFFAPSVVRAAGIKAKLLVDNGEYAHGWPRPDKDETRVTRQHEAFVELLRDCAEDTNESDVWAIVRYLDLPETRKLRKPEDLDPAQNMTFSVEGRYPFQNSNVQDFWGRYASNVVDSNDESPICLACGEQNPIVRLLPQKIKGVPGGQTSGTALVSTNANAFYSYGLDDMSCAPICIECAEGACKALNALLDDENSRVYIRPLVYAFWTRDDTGFNVGMLLSQPDAGQVGALFRAARTGRQASVAADPNPFYCLGLAGSGGRVAVRDWIDTSAERVRDNLVRYFALQELVDPYGQEHRYFGLFPLTRATLRQNASGNDEPAPTVPRALMRCALLGGPLPSWLLTQVMKRVRAERNVTHQRAVLIKMVLASQQQEGRESYMAGLDEESRSPAYLCGRLLAVLDSIQRAALGSRNATIIDRFFGTASTAPLAVFGRLTRGAQPHLAKLRRDRPGAYQALESRMQEIMQKLDGFPNTLTLNQQGEFVLGYYHQRAADRAAAIRNRELRDAVDEPLADENDDTE